MNRLITIVTFATVTIAVAGCGDDDGGGMTGVDSGTAMDDGGTMGTDSGTDVDSGAGTDAGTMDGFAFRDDAPSAYVRVDRMGMPAVSTALIASKNDYNDDDPADDASGVWVDEIVAALTTLHTALEDDFDTLGITGCADYTGDTVDPTACTTQEVVSGVTVADLVIPDTLSIDTAGDAGFPNGRRLADPVMDVTLSVILLDLTVHSPTFLFDADGDGSPGPSPTPLNPPANDVSFADAFPYLAAPHE